MMGGICIKNHYVQNHPFTIWGGGGVAGKRDFTNCLWQSTRPKEFGQNILDENIENEENGMKTE
jgi:hypothetical protein